MKVCHIVNSLVYGGVEKVVENNCNNRNNTYYIIAQDNSKKEHIKYFENKGFIIFIIPHKKKNFIKHYLMLKRIMKKNDFDVVHAHTSLMNFYPLRIAKKRNIKVRINHIHNIFYGGKTKSIIYSLLLHMCQKNATKNVVCSDAVGKFTKYSTVTIVRNKFEVSKYKYNEKRRIAIRNKLQLTDNSIMLCCVGRLTKQKNQVFLIKVMDSLVKENENYRLFFIGNGEQESYLKKEIKKRKLEKYIFFLGNVEVSNYYPAMDVFLLPSLYEGLGIVSLEAQCSNTPCVLSSFVPVETKYNENVFFENLNVNLWVSRIETFKSLHRNETVCERLYLDYNLENTKNEFDLLYEE